MMNEQARVVNGILIEDKSGNRSLVHPHELSTFTRLEVCKFEQVQRMLFEQIPLLSLAK